MVKAYGCTIDYVLHDISFANVLLYNAVLPSYDSNRQDSKNDVINASDPKNKEAVHKVLFG